MDSADIVLGVMARAPSDPGKTRLLGSLGISDGEPLRRALLLDTVESVTRVTGVTPAILYTPDGAADEFRRLIRSPLHLIPQRSGDLGARLHGAFEDLRSFGPLGTLIIGSDLPTIPTAYLGRGAEQLRQKTGQVVLGPAADGGYYLIGLSDPEARLFENIPWSTDRVFQLTMATAMTLGLAPVELPVWYDVDSEDDLARALREVEGLDVGSHVGRHTLAWARQAPAGVQSRLGI